MSLDDGTPARSAAGSTPEEALKASLDLLVQEVRRQGRAAIAAQAAGESCIEAIGALRGDLEAERARDEAEADAPADAEALVRALLPFADGLDRVCAEVARMAATEPSRLDRLLGRRAPAALGPIATGLALLRAQLDDLLTAAGVTIDRRAGIPVEAEAHRVIEARPHAGAPGTVLEILRPGYAFAGRRLREADVAVARGH